MKPLNRSPQPKQQATIFNTSIVRQANYAELCAALYDNATKELAEHRSLDRNGLQLRLGSLSYYIGLATEKLLNLATPLQLDVHNGSWHSKQASSCKAQTIDLDGNDKWYRKHAKIALPVPVYIGLQHQQYLELDVIDKVDQERHAFRLNKHGWFSFAGQPNADGNDQPENTESKVAVHLTKPTKISMTAACCGHRWNYKGKTMPRRLTLRELLLTTSINWQNYTKTRP